MMKDSNVSLLAMAHRLRALGVADDRRLINGRVAVCCRTAPERIELILAHYAATKEPVECIRQQYGELHLGKERIAVSELCRRLNDAVETRSFEVVEGIKAQVNGTVGVELLPSDDPQTGNGPRYLVDISASNRGHLSQGLPLIAYGKPSFESVEQAVRSWIPLRPFHGSSDGRVGSILIEFPLSGPRFGALAMEGERCLCITVDGVPDEMPLELTGVWQSRDGGSIVPFAHKVEGKSVEVSRPPWAEQVAIWLVRPDSLVTDFFFENSYRCSRSQRVLLPPANETKDGELSPLAQIESGEGETLEFKPFVKLNSADKFDEIIRTVIAFANKRGGRIYLGVSDYQDIEGIEKELWEATPPEERKSVNDCARWYCDRVLKRIRDRLSIAVEVEVEPLSVSDKLLIRVSVEETKEKPCLDVIRNDIWTRRGANTVKPNGQELKQLITEPTPPTPFPGLFGQQ